jgi:hypothetical protein
MIFRTTEYGAALLLGSVSPTSTLAIRCRNTFGNRRSPRRGGPPFARTHSLKYLLRRPALGFSPSPRFHQSGTRAISSSSSVSTSQRMKHTHRPMTCRSEIWPLLSTRGRRLVEFAGSRATQLRPVWFSSVSLCAVPLRAKSEVVPGVHAAMESLVDFMTNDKAAGA